MLIFCEAPVQSVSGPGGPRRSLCRAPRSLCWVPALSRSLRQAPPGAARRSLRRPVVCQAPTLSVSGPTALSLSVSALSVSELSSRRSQCRARRRCPALSVSLCRAASALSTSGPGALASHPSSGPRTRAPGSATLRPRLPSGPAGPQLRSACHIQPGAFPFARKTQTFLFGGIYIYMYTYTYIYTYMYI